MVHNLKFEKLLHINKDIVRKFEKSIELEIQQRHQKKGEEDDISDEDELRTMVKDQKRTVDFILEREENS